MIKSMKKRFVAPRMLGKPWSPCEVDLAQAISKGHGGLHLRAVLRDGHRALRLLRLAPLPGESRR